MAVDRMITLGSGQKLTRRSSSPAGNESKEEVAPRLSGESRAAR